MSITMPAQAEATSVATGALQSERTSRRSRQRAMRPSARPIWDQAGQRLLEMPTSTWMIADSILVAIALHVGYSVVGASATVEIAHIDIWQAYAVFVGAFLFASLVFGLYERETLWSRSRIVVRTLLTTAVAVVIAYAVIYVLMYSNASRRAVGCAVLVYIIVGTSVRMGAWWLIQKVRRPLLVVGSKALFESFRSAQQSGLLSEYRLTGYTSDGLEAPDAGSARYCLGRHHDIQRIRTESHVTDMVVSAEVARRPEVMSWIVPCLQDGCRVTNEATFYEKATGQILVDELTPQWFLLADLTAAGEDRVSLKRIVDLTTSIIGLCLTLPLWPLIALAIKLNDAGPVFYSQDRVGLKGKCFRIRKFRTMRVDAENGQSIWASPNDPRVTCVGRFLRVTRLDELPQLLNILVGQMSLIGPRPERPDIVETLTEKISFYNERHLIKPGLTGWAQINYKYGSCVEDAKRKLQFDLYYLKNACFELDMMILFRTLGTFLRGGC